MTISEEAIELREKNRGILETSLKMPVQDRHDLAVIYTPGVAEPCLRIKEDPDLSFCTDLPGQYCGSYF